MEIQLWRSILCPYELAVRELEVKFNHIIDECKENAQQLVRDGYCYVMIFECEDPAPEEISWDYVKSNQVDS